MRREDNAPVHANLAGMASRPMASRPMALRLIAAAILFSVWFVVLLAGSPLRGWIHLVLLAALAVFPWRAVSISPRGED